MTELPIETVNKELKEKIILSVTTGDMSPSFIYIGMIMMALWHKERENFHLGVYEKYSISMNGSITANTGKTSQHSICKYKLTDGVTDVPLINQSEPTRRKLHSLICVK